MQRICFDFCVCNHAKDLLDSSQNINICMHLNAFFNSVRFSLGATAAGRVEQKKLNEG